MRIVSLNVSAVREVHAGGRLLRTGIFKMPTAAPTLLSERGFAGDDQADKRHHGWPTQAAYAFSALEYDHWKLALGRLELPYGLFGENLTIDELDDSTVCIGDVYAIGDARVQVTFPRVPCSTLAAAVGEKDFVKAFLERKRCGPYFRVLSPGVVTVGDRLELTRRDSANLSLMEAMDLMHFAEKAHARWKQASEIEAMDERWRTKFAAKAASI